MERLTWHTGNAKKVRGADVEGFQNIGRIVCIDHCHFADGMGGGTDPDKRGELLVRLCRLLAQRGSLLQFSVQPRDLVLLLRLVLLWRRGRVEDAGAHDVSPVLGAPARQVDPGCTPDLHPWLLLHQGTTVHGNWNGHILGRNGWMVHLKV